MILILLLVSVQVCVAQQAKNMGTMKIVDVRKTTLPADNLKQHKYHDVLVYREASGQDGNACEGYEVHFYSNWGDTLFCYKAGAPAHGEFTDASYKWENDTLADITLYSKGNKDKASFKVFGVAHNGRKTSGISWDE